MNTVITSSCVANSEFDHKTLLEVKQESPSYIELLNNTGVVYNVKEDFIPVGKFARLGDVLVS